MLGVAAAGLETVEIAWSWTLVAAFAYTTLVPGLAATLVWFWLVNRIGATKAATFHFLNPFFGVLIAALTRPSLPAAEYSPSPREWITIAAIGVVLLGVYFGLLIWWKRKRIPNHTLSSRRTFLRGGLGFAAFLLFLLLVAWPYQKRIAAEISAPLPEVSTGSSSVTTRA